MYTYIHIYINLCIHVHLRSRSWVQTRRRVYILCILYVRKESSHQTMCTVYMHTNKQTYTNECVYTNTITRAPVRIFARVCEYTPYVRRVVCTHTYTCTKTYSHTCI